MEGMVAIDVISPPSLDRGHPVFHDLAKLGVVNVRRVGFGPEVVDDPQVRSRLDPRGARVHSGAVLTDEQVACLLSHHAAITESMERARCPWSIVLEDDARIEEGFEEFLRGLPSVDLHHPAIISLYSMGKIVPQQRATAIRLGGTKVIPLNAPPASAVGYAVNVQAVDVIRQFGNWPIFTRSDWPPWSGLINFYLCDPFVVGHEDGPSTMPSIPASPRGLRRFARAVSKLSLVSFAAAPESYGRSLPLYLRHSWLPSIRYLTHDLLRGDRSPQSGRQGSH